jgi:hypothetical protein
VTAVSIAPCHAIPTNHIKVPKTGVDQPFFLFFGPYEVMALNLPMETEKQNFFWLLEKFFHHCWWKNLLRGESC